MAVDVLTISFDVAESRVETDRIALLVTGEANAVLQWDIDNSSGIFVEGITNTAFLIPNAFTTAFDEDATGVNARLRLADTNQAANPAYTEYIQNDLPNNYYIMGQNTNAPLTLNKTYEKNVAWYFSYFAFGQGDAFLQFQATWGNVVLQIYSDGEVVWSKNGLKFGSGNLTHFQPAKTGDVIVSHKKAPRAGAAKGAIQNTAIKFVVIPCRERELIFLCNHGGGFRSVLEDIAPGTSDTTILPSCRPIFQIPNGKPVLQFAPLQYATTGVLKSNLRYLREPPVDLAEPTTTTLFDIPTSGTADAVGDLMDEDGVTPFVGDGIKETCIMSIDMTGDGLTTPFIYGAYSVFDSVTAMTDGTHQQTVDGFTEEFNLTVGDSPSSVTATVGLLYADSVDAILAHSKRVGNRAINCRISRVAGDIAFLTGRSGTPSFTDGPVDGSRKLMYEFRDWWKVYETYQIQDPTPFDGMRFKDAIEQVARYPGFTAAQMDVEDFDFVIPSDGQTSDGDFAVIPEIGDTCAKWLEKFWEDYAKFAYFGWYPSATGPKFRFKSEDALGTTADCTLYRTRQVAVDALMALGMTAAEAEIEWPYHVITFFKEDTIELEANEIRITGWDDRIDKAFQSVWHDTDSQKVTTFPSAFPDNWLGEPRRIAIFNPAIRNQGVADWVAGVIRSRVSRSRRTATIKCQMQFNADLSPVWRGNVIKIDGVGRYRVNTLTGGHIIEAPTTFVDPEDPESGDVFPGNRWREYNYVMRYIGA